MNDSTNVRGGDVNPDQLDRWLEDRKQYHERKAREAAARRRVIPFGRAFENLLRLDAAGKLTDQAKAAVIGMAAAYARRNKMPFDRTLQGAIQLAAQADRILRDHMGAMAKLN